MVIPCEALKTNFINSYKGGDIMNYNDLIMNKSTNNKYLYIWDKLHGLHSRLFSKCYNENNKKYSVYGGRGVKVSDEWKDTNVFIKDAIKLPGFNPLLYIKGSLHLDKDIKVPNSMIYSKDTCIWVTNEVNEKYKTSKWGNYYAYNFLNDTLYSFKNMTMFANRMGIKPDTLYAKISRSSNNANSHPADDNWIIWDNDTDSKVAYSVYSAVINGKLIKSLNAYTLESLLGVPHSTFNKTRVNHDGQWEYKEYSYSYCYNGKHFYTAKDCANYAGVSSSNLTARIRGKSSVCIKGKMFYKEDFPEKEIKHLRVSTLDPFNAKYKIKLV